eukprot:scaffold26459_cov162-Cylindrotheca_fusiformis.AAC.4
MELKQKVNESSQKFDEKQRLVYNARNDLEKALKAWEDSQSQHTRLLQARDRWTPTEAQEFATLVQSEVQVRNDLKRAKENLSERESQQASAQTEYMNDLRRRYHEEQIWQDKWRVMSTFGTWGLIVLNSIVFLISQYLYRMRETRRMKEIESLLHQTLTSNTSTLQAIQDQQEYHQSQQSARTEEPKPEAHTSDQGKEVPTSESEMVSTDQESSKEPRIEKSTISWKDRLLVLDPRNKTWDVAGWRDSLAAAWKDAPQNIDAPSAVFGASVTALAWIAVVSLSSRRSGP